MVFCNHCSPRVSWPAPHTMTSSLPGQFCVSLHGAGSSAATASTPLAAGRPPP